MKTKVIDIRKLKQDPEKVVAYWVSQGGKEAEEDACDTPESHPYCGIDAYGYIDSWRNLGLTRVEIDLPKDLLVADLLIADLESIESKHRKDLIDEFWAVSPKEEFKTGDRVVDDFGKLATVVGTLDGVTYYKDDDGVEIFDTTLFPIKHYKEPEEPANNKDRKLRLLCHFQHFLGSNYNNLPTDSGTMTERARMFLEPAKEEPELFEGWVNIYDDRVYETEDEARQICSGGRVFKVREVKDES
jgi:hypothetical protein